MSHYLVDLEALNAAAGVLKEAAAVLSGLAVLITVWRSKTQR